MNTLKNSGAVGTPIIGGVARVLDSPAERNTMPAVKKVLDLNNILNPGVIFPLDNRYFMHYNYNHHFNAFKEIQ